MSEGLVLVHLAPKALLSHVEWTLSGISGAPVTINWTQTSAPTTTFRGSVGLALNQDAGATLAAAFMNLKQLTFEIIVQDEKNGYRWSFTPSLGMFSSPTDEAGNLVINENQMRSAMEIAGSNALRLQAELRRLLGQAWDDELEPYRELIGGAESNHGVVSAEAEGIAYGQNVRPL